MPTLKRSVAFGLISVTASTVLGLGLVLTADIFLHQRFEKAAGLNIWGYRGPTAPKKNAEAWRVAVVGGSTAFGYGVQWRDSFPSHLETQLKRAQPDDDITVVNLAYNNEGAYSFSFTLSDYSYLDYDVALLYTGYNDLTGENRQVYRHQSPVFRLTGYSPIMPLIFQEKAMLLRSGDTLEESYWGGKTVFRENLFDQTAATALETAVSLGDSLKTQLDKIAPRASERAVHSAICSSRWNFYCESIYNAVSYIISRGKTVLVVTQPYIHDLHRDQQKVLADMLHEQFSSESNVYYSNLGNTIELENKDLAFDGMHLLAEGNKRVAEHLVQPLLNIKNKQFPRLP